MNSFNISLRLVGQVIGHIVLGYEIYKMLILLLSHILICCSCAVNRTITKLQFKGFIYPYVIYLHRPNDSSTQLILFEPISTRGVFPSLTDRDRDHLQKYNHIGSFMIPSNKFSPPQIVVKDSLFIVKNVNSQMSWSIAYLKRPHLHRFYLLNNMTKELEGFVNFFHRREQNVKFRQPYLFDASELWRSWIFVKLQQNKQEMVIVLRREPGHSLSKKYAFVKEYFAVGEIQNIALQKHPSLTSLQLLIVSEKKFCLFHIDRDLTLVFRYCSLKQHHIIQLVPINPSQVVIFYSLRASSPVFKFQIQLIQQNSSVCIITLPVPHESPFFLHKFIHNRIVVCALVECYSYSLNCERVSAVQQEVPSVSNIFYQRIEHEYLQYVYSTVIVQSKNQTFIFTECDDPSLLVKQTGLCQKADSQIDLWIDNKYSTLGCYQCSRTPRCYFQNGKCRYLPNKEVELFSDEVYSNKSLFLESYSRFEAGITSECNKTLKCSISTSTISSSINIQQDDESLVQSSCQLLLPVSSNSQFLIRLDSENKFDLQICSSDFAETLFTCILENVTNTKTNTYKTFAGNYILFLFMARSGGPNWSSFEVTNLNQESLQNTALIFSQIVIGFVILVLLLILYVVLRNRMLTQLALRGWIQFRPSSRYPLSDTELTLKIKYYCKQGYIRQIQDSSLETSKQINEQCCFCLSNLYDGKRLFQIYCRHQFHKSCLSQWFQLEPSSDRCPICKRLFLTQEVARFNSANYEFNRRASTSAISQDRINI